MIVAAGQFGRLRICLGQGEAVHVRHVSIKQHQRERLARRAAPARLASASRPPDASRPHTPTTEHFLQDAAVGRVVVHHQYGQICPGRSASLASPPSRAGIAEA